MNPNELKQQECSVFAPSLTDISALRQPVRVNPAPTETFPSSISREITSDGIVITRRWRNYSFWVFLPITAMCILIDAALFRATYGEPFNSPIHLFPLFFALVGLTMMYVLLVKSLNRTRILVTQQRLSIQHGPLPSRSKDISLPLDTIRRFYVKPYSWRYDGMRATHYHLWLERSDGHHAFVLAGDETQAEAEFIQKELQDVLNRRV